MPSSSVTRVEKFIACDRRRVHSSLAPVAMTTGPHLACSAFTKAAYSAGVVGAGVAFWLSNCCLNSADCDRLDRGLLQLVEDIGRHAGRAPRGHTSCPTARSRSRPRRRSARPAAPCCACRGHRQRLDLAGPDVRQQHRHVGTIIWTWPPSRSFTAGAAPR